ncbi:nitrous oxide reductase accessory protein NosL [Kurthia zopfii]|uniref:nitrous oxide reductase accessory protein NosL n=1 Tax=Kurthia zopfii TaxID=1650 RepID=UPI000F6BDD96|nr:nitrous oxide reductase accessory protein NosL [Kurthia zopfii]VEI05810.1 NosL [Kurthia zopfii]
MKKKWMSAVLATSILLAGCGNKDFEAKEINPQTDICKICNMSIANEKYAGQIALKNGDYQMYDDLGCLMQSYNKTKHDDIGEAFIKDQAGKEWLNVEKSAFVYEKSIPTPMSYGVVAFKDEAAAKEYVKKQGTGKVMNFDELKSFDWGE